jgi:hypothetical protein
VDIIEIITLAGFDFLESYADSLLQTGNILDFLFKQFTYYILLQLALYFVPFLKRILVIFFIPFRWIHVYLHIYAAKQLQKEIKEKKNQRKMEFLVDDSSLRASLVSGVDIADENPGLLIAFNRFEYAKRVAFSSNKLAFLLLLGYLAVTPLILTDNSVFSSNLGALIHLYFFIGIFGVLMPSLNDWYFVIHALMINLELNPKWFNLSVLVYIAFTLDTLWRTNNFFLAIFLGTIWFIFYILGLFITVYIARGGKKPFSQFLWLPPEKLRHRSPLNADIEFLSLEDIDI